MRGIKLRGQPDPPSLVGIDLLHTIVVVLPFRVYDTTQTTRLVYLAHHIQVFPEARCLKHHILETRAFHRFKQLLSFLDISEGGRHRARDVLAVIKHLHAVTCMARRIRSHKYRLNVFVLHHFFQGRISLVTTGYTGKFCTTVRKQIADGHDFHVRMILEAEGSGKLADTVSDKTHTYLPVRDRHPFGLYFFFRRFFKTLNGG